MTAPDTATPLAAVLSTAEPERLYSGLSVLVSTAVNGTPCAALASFGALALILDPDDIGRRPLSHASEHETFVRSLVELIDTAIELDSLTIHACAASVQTMGLDPATVTERLDGVKSTPRFLRDTAGSRLIFV